MKDQAGEPANATTTIESLRFELEARQRELDGCRQLIEQMESQRRAEDDRSKRWWLLSPARENHFSILDALPTFVTLMTPDGELEYTNSNILEYFGSTLEELKGWEPGSTLHPDDRADVIAEWRKSVETSSSFDFEGRHRAANGVYHWFHMRGFPLRDSEGRIVLWYLLHTDIDRRKRAEALLAGEKRLLEMMAAGGYLSATLSELCLLAEDLFSGCACCSVLVLNLETNEYWHAASPSVPNEFTESIGSLAIDSNTNSCGPTAYTSRQVIASDIATDPRWAEIRELALAKGLRACWSTPIVSRQNRVLGIFVMFSDKTGNPATDDQEVFALTTRLASFAVERAESETALKSSEARKTAILDSALDCIVTIDHEARITEFNPASERTFGYRRDEVVGKQLADVIVPPSLREQHNRGFTRYLATGEARVLGRRLEITGVRADGSEFPVELAITRIPIDGPPSFTGYLRDITERKQSEENLRRSKAYLAEAQQLSRTGSFGWKVSSGEFTWSEETFRIFEFDPTTKPTVELILKRVHPEDVPVVNQLIERASQDRKDWELEHRLLMPGGAVKHVRIVAHAERIELGEIEFVGAVMDITAAKKTEADIRTSAKIAQGLVAIRADVSAALSKPIQAREILQECAQALVRHLDATFARIWTLNQREDLLELQASAGSYTRLDGKYSRIKVGNLKVGLIAREQKPYLTNDVLNDPRIGEKDWARSCGLVSFAGYPLVVDGRTVGVMAMFARHALSEATVEALASVADTIAQGFQRKRKEDELRRTEAYLSEGQRLSHTGSWALKVKTKENLFWSKEHYCIYGFDPDADIGQYAAARERIHPDDACAFDETLDRALQARSDFETHHRIILPGGAIKHLHVLGHPVFDNSGEVVEYIGTVMDVTERQRSEEALRKAQADLAHVSRVTTMGELTASIAHEVNQPLGSVINNANACLGLLPEGAPPFNEVREALAEIIQGVEQASAVITRVKQLVRKTPSERTVLNLRDVVVDVLALARYDTAARRVAIRTELTEDMPSVKGDRVQLQQVLLNLVVNGLDAMSAIEESKRLLTICGRRETQNGERCCLLSVQDAGAGLKPNEMDLLFEPFYTTKTQGIGMGLAISRSIIEAHGGRLWADTNQGLGATFIFSLPAASDVNS